MKTLFFTIAAFAIVASASATENAICKGQVGKHAIEDGGGNYISCVQKTNGDIVAEIRTCPEGQTWCPETNSCGDPHEEPKIFIHIINEHGDDCDGEHHHCHHHETLQWFESENEHEHGCFPACVPNGEHHIVEDGLESRHHDQDWELMRCQHGTCTCDSVEYATCRDKDGTCPEKCCGKGCTTTPPSGPCPDDQKPVKDPEDCSKFCCGPKTSGLFGSGFRGQTGHGGCESCGDNLFWCIDENKCVTVDTESHKCKAEIFERCHCRKIRNHHNCKEFKWVCDDIEGEFPGHCGVGELFHEDCDGHGNGGCIPETHPNYHHAVDACLCPHGGKPKHDGCSGWKCCDESTSIFGLEPNNNCDEGGQCDDTCEFWCGSSKRCVNFDEKHTCEDEYNEHCCGHTATGCRSFTKTCMGDDSGPHLNNEEECPGGVQFCSNHGRCWKHGDTECHNTHCKCPHGSDIFHVKSHICCDVKTDSKESSGWWKDLVRPTPGNQCTPGGIHCDTCPTGTQPCGNTCIHSKNQCHEHVPYLDHVCEECEHEDKTKICGHPFHFFGHKKHHCNKVLLCEHDGHHWVPHSEQPVGHCHKSVDSSKPVGEIDAKNCNVCTKKQIDHLKQQNPHHYPTHGCQNGFNCCKDPPKAQ